MASTCVWFPYPDSACLVLGCVRVCVLPQRLSKGKYIGSILDDRGRLRDAFYFNRQNLTRSGLPVLGRCSRPGAARALVKRMRLPRRRPTMAKSSYPDLSEINYKPAHPVTGRSGALNASGSVPTGSLAGDGRYACSPGSGGPGWRRISGLASGAVVTSARGVRGKSGSPLAERPRPRLRQARQTG